MTVYTKLITPSAGDKAVILPASHYVLAGTVYQGNQWLRLCSVGAVGFASRWAGELSSPRECDDSLDSEGAFTIETVHRTAAEAKLRRRFLKYRSARAAPPEV